MTSTPILWERPYACAVSEEYFHTICHVCFRETDTLQLCPECNTTPYCSDECQEYDEDTGAHVKECGLYKSIPDSQLEILKTLRYARFHARVLSRQNRDAGIGRDDDVSDFPFVSSKWRNMADLLAHSDKISPEAQNELRVMYRKFKPYFSFVGEENFIQSYGVLQTNSFGVTRYSIYGERNLLGCAIYLQASCLNHSCIPDIRLSFVQGNRLSLIPKHPIDLRKNPLASYSICYAANSCLTTTQERRKALSEEKHFFCECPQCLDENSDLVKRKGLAKYCPQCQEQDGGPSNKRLALKEGNEFCVVCGYSRALVKEESQIVKETLKKIDVFRKEVIEGKGKSWDDWSKFIMETEKVFDPLRYVMIIRMREALSETIWEEWNFAIPKSGKGRDIFYLHSEALLKTYAYFNVFTSEYPSLLAKIAYAKKDEGKVKEAIEYYGRARELWENVVDGCSGNCVHDIDVVIEGIRAEL